MKELLFLVKNNIAAYVPGFAFRKGQKPMTTKIMNAISNGILSMYLKAPTGIGKTFIIAMIIDAVLGNSKNIKVLVLTKASLVTQVSGELTRFLPQRRNTRFSGKEKEISGEIVVMSFASYRCNPELHNMFNILLLDEAHKAMGKITRALIDEHKKSTITVGFTASSYYSDLKNLKEFLGPEVYSISVKEATQMGLLCSIQLAMANINIELSEKMKTESPKQYEERSSSEIIRRGGNKAAAHLFAEKFQPMNLRGIMFTLTKRQGEDLVKQLDNYKVRSRLITGDMKQNERKILFRSFRNHEFDVLVGIGTIKEGFDDPGVAFCMPVFPVRSFVDMIQMYGRALRIDPNNPAKRAWLIMPHFEGIKNQYYYHQFLGSDHADNPVEKKLRDSQAKKYEQVIRSYSTDKLKVSLAYSNFMKIDILVKHETPLIGWLTASKIASDINIITGHNVIKRFVERYRRSNLNWFLNYWSGNSIVEHYSPDLIKLIYKEYQYDSNKFAPNGWMYLSEIQQLNEISVDRRYLSKYIYSFKVSNPEWFSFFRLKKSIRIVEYYHPNLIIMVKNKFNLRFKKKPPKYWKSLNKILEDKLIKTSKSFILEFVDKYRYSNSNWFHNYWTGNYIVEHYHPDLVKLIYSNFNVRKAPDGWFNIKQLRNASSTKFRRESLDIFTKKYRESNPEWFGIYLSVSQLSEHYHPELAVLIIENYTYKNAPSDWVQLSRLSDLGVTCSYTKIMNFLKKYRNSNPEWFGYYCSLNKNIKREYISKELTAIVVENLIK